MFQKKVPKIQNVDFGGETSNVRAEILSRMHLVARPGDLILMVSWMHIFRDFGPILGQG